MRLIIVCYDIVAGYYCNIAATGISLGIFVAYLYWSPHREAESAKALDRKRVTTNAHPPRSQLLLTRDFPPFYSPCSRLR